MERTQTVVFLRHAVGLHNLPSPDGRPIRLKDPSCLDPPLVSPDGRFQAVLAGAAIQTYLRGNIDLVVTSPLTRCLETAVTAFWPGDEMYRTGLCTPILCHEAVREAFGVHYTDKRRDKFTLQVCVIRDCWICSNSFAHWLFGFVSCCCTEQMGRHCSV